MSEPTTEAGKRLLVTFRSMYEDAEWLAAAEFDIAAIEAEARAQGALHAHLVNEGDIEQARAAVLRELREEVEGMGDNPPPHAKGREAMYQSALAAVLAAIDRRLP